MRWKRCDGVRRPTLIAGALLVLLAPALSSSAVSITIPSKTLPSSPPVTRAVRDLAVTITDNATTVEPDSVVDTIVTVTNRWSDTVQGVKLLYPLPQGQRDGGLTALPTNNGGTVSVNTPPVGTGYAFDPPPGDTVFTFKARTVGNATGTISSSVTLLSPGSFGDIDASNNTAVDLTQIAPPVKATTAPILQDASVAITDNATSIEPGTAVVTTITVTNPGGIAPAYLRVMYTPPPSHTASTAICRIATGGGACGPPIVGDGSINQPIFVNPDKSVLFLVTATVTPAATGTITSTVKIVASDGFAEKNTLNDQAIDTTLINSPTAATATTSIPTATTVASTTVVTGPPPAAAASAATPSAAGNVNGFQSPAGQTRCRLIANPVTGQAMRCTVIGSTAKLPRRPATCDFDWKDIAVNATGRSYTVCAGDSIDANYPVLAYGQTWKRSVFTCTSAKSGITCRNPSKRGFRVTKAKRTYL